MPHLDEALIGAPDGARRLSTPALVIDLGPFERNIALMQAHCDRAGLKLRPHAKTHKSSAIARRQIKAGAIGQCCAKLGEAEALAVAGVDGLLVTSPVVTPAAFARVARLNASLDDFMIVADSACCVEGYAGAAEASGRRLKVLIDVDIGLHRTGAQPGRPALALARKVADSPVLELAGLQGYAGHLQHVADFGERRGASVGALRLLAETRDAILGAGLPCPIVSGGGTGTFDIDAEAGVFTELQAGSYIFMDRQYRDVGGRNAATLPFETALFVATTVISAPVSGMVTTDAGLKSFATEAGPPFIHSGAPAGARYFFFGDEQGGVAFGGEDTALALGSRLLCAAPHCDPTVNLYDFYHVIDGDQLVALWPIEARGRSA
ncbi:MAG: DSD1 family PLP-dependent enzyme [Parvularculaceae bacterium]